MKREDKFNIKEIDKLLTNEMVDLLLKDLTKSIKKINNCSEKITEAINLINKKIKKGGKLYFMGSGASSATLLAEKIELNATFTLKNNFIEIINSFANKKIEAIGTDFDNNYNVGHADIFLTLVDEKDVLLVMSTASNEKYVTGILDYTKEKGISTILINYKKTNIFDEKADINIVLPVKEKDILDFTILKNSVLQNIVLKTILMGVMIKIGKIYKQQIVDINSNMYKQEAVQVVRKVARVSEAKAIEYLQMCQYRPKLAIVMLKNKVTLREAITLLKNNNGDLRKIIK